MTFRQGRDESWSIAVSVMTGVRHREFHMPHRRLLVASAAALFAVAVAPDASAGGGVKCRGVNSCKGTSACKTATSSCKGQNSCKGMGWSEVATRDDCVSRGGKVF
jgi:hypothetical protein